MKKYLYSYSLIAGFFMLLIDSSNLIAQAPLACNRTNDSMELVSFYNQYDGDNWTNNTNWLVPGESIDTWYGVEVSAQGCVIGLRLDENNLVGKLMDLKLNNLRVLSLSKNFIEGELVNFSNIPLVDSLNLSDNLISGTLPDFNNLGNLVTLDISVNSIEGPIPDFSKFPKLVTLSLYDNSLTGSIPDFTKLRSLETMWIDGNQLSGTIPNFSNLPELGSLYLGRNNFSGTIPVFTKVPQMFFLSYGENNFTGTIPQFTNMPKLWMLDLSSCNLSGSIPTLNLPNLHTLFLRNNNFTGPLPDFSNVKLLDFLELGANQLTGSLPDFSNLPDLYSVWLYDNFFSGPIPNSPFVEFYHYEGNKFTFSDILASGKKSPNYYYDSQKDFYTDTVIMVAKNKPLIIDLGIDKNIKDNNYDVYLVDNGLLNYRFSQDSNKILFSNPQASNSGRYIVKVSNPRLPLLELKSKTISLRICDVQKDSMELVRLYNSTGGNSWTNHNNWLIPGKKINEWYGIHTNNLGCVQSIDLSNNNLQGSIPLLDLNTLDTAIFANNVLNGKIPEVKIPFIKTLNLSQNQLSGPIPQTINNWNNIQNLNLSKNGLSGGVPPDLGDLCDLRSLKINDNKLKGQLPDNLTMLPNLEVGKVDFGNNEIDSLNDKFIWFCPFGDSIFRSNPAYDRFLGICNVKCSGKEFESLKDFAWIEDTIKHLNCKLSNCEFTDVHAGFVNVRNVKVFYTHTRCYTVKGPPSEYSDEVKFYDCGGHLLEVVNNTDKNNFATMYHAITQEDFDNLAYDIKWTCGQSLNSSTSTKDHVNRSKKWRGVAFKLDFSPNPAIEKTTCVIPEFFETNPIIALTNNLGQVFSVDYIKGPSSLELNVSKLQTGIYTVTVRSANQFYTGKIFVQKI
ncbi:MAG: T9SS type A sorting domain-containing protein [Saprospiraceae bacterium]|nr:T9SS type A sorting domain-containing protein [Saprospiraceae bacterium]HMW39732.1 T9SS type A sorting domain-containing protein [Saprospiraceae bacterium]HMX88240.1 T9SS type A sorting domain-containing protein [Saprospiraceae bacterium]HMZ40701.1 T9SS type A sorting domain-containing protein [Saprospiraceae bacterium]HNA65111.1 T9SS type A sorting domain-containing protein [Saprospiraceae bacterium]